MHSLATAAGPNAYDSLQLYQPIQPAKMKTDLNPTPEQFQKLLAWLDEDPARAGLKYEEIRRRLIMIFLNRGCQVPEELADETINRVTRKICELVKTYEGDPARYFYGVAKKIFSEHIRKVSKRRPDPPPVASNAEFEPHLNCLDQCLDTLDPESRTLILDYYREKKQAKIISHKEMGEKLGINTGALRARIHRIRGKLAKCLEECLERTGESNDIN